MAANGNKTPSITQDRRSRFLLVVDHDAGNIFYTSMLLQRFGYHICSAKSAKEAIEMATVAVPALIITELTFKGPGGLELIGRLRQEPRTAAVPVIIQTEQCSAEVIQQCRRAGAAACLQKPIRAEELYRAVQATIEPTPRTNIRIQTRLPVTVNDTPLDCIEGECASILSEHGMYVRTLKPLPKNTQITIKITLQNSIITAVARVIYCHKFGEGPFGEPGMGVQFLQVSPEDQACLDAYILEQVQNGIR